MLTKKKEMSKTKIEKLADEWEEYVKESYLKYISENMSEFVKHLWEIEKGGLDGHIKEHFQTSQEDAEEVANELYDRHFIEDEDSLYECNEKDPLLYSFLNKIK